MKNMQETRERKQRKLEKWITEEREVIGLNIIHMNVRGLQAKRYEVKEMLIEKDIQIAIMAESHAKEDQNITIAGYTWIGSEARTGASGGVGILIQNCIANQVKV